MNKTTPRLVDTQLRAFHALYFMLSLEGISTNTLDRMITRGWLKGTNLLFTPAGETIAKSLFHTGERLKTEWPVIVFRVAKSWHEPPTRTGKDIARIIWPRHTMNTQGLRFVMTPILNRLVREGILRKHGGGFEPTYSQIKRSTAR